MSTLSNPSQTANAQDGALPTHDVRNLTRCGDQAHLVLDGQTHTLRITRAGKLILTK